MCLHWAYTQKIDQAWSQMNTHDQRKSFNSWETLLSRKSLLISSERHLQVAAEKKNFWLYKLSGVLSLIDTIVAFDWLALIGSQHWVGGERRAGGRIGTRKVFHHGRGFRWKTMAGYQASRYTDFPFHSPHPSYTTYHHPSLGSGWWQWCLWASILGSRIQKFSCEDIWRLDRLW